MEDASPRPRIVVVDDEPRSVELLVRTLRRLGDVEPFTSADEAWARVQAEPPDLLISDQRMPGMKGVDLLARVAGLDVPVARVLLTGYADIHATVEAINAGRIHAYVNKPWSPDQLVQIATALLERTWFERDNVRLLTSLVAKNAELEMALGSVREAQSRMLAAERLAAVGQMVAMIVHDIRGPLTVVRSSTEELARDAGSLPVEEIRALAGGALEESERIMRMCSELLDATRASEDRSERSPCEIDEWVEDVVATIAESAGRQGIRIETRLESAATLWVDVERLRRALMNLLYNAFEAMPEGGLVRIETRRDADLVCLDVEDTGPGILETIRERLFEAFATAGKPGGTGLGLAVVRKIVEDHGGSVTAEKAEGGGARFALRLPLESAVKKGAGLDSSTFPVGKS
ncbi:hybrid sensor histidine kinase/response regulator [Myxococcota bacterium]|nr:hybrid sensor histidine kinase/response regulator [Myxococcota bacterium]